MMTLHAIEPTEGTQAHTILERLRRGPICSSEIYAQDSPITHRLAARVYDLRVKGWAIDTQNCENGEHHHVAPMVEYVLGLPEISYPEGKLFT